MKRTTRHLFLLFSLMFFAISAGAQTVPVGDPVYELIDLSLQFSDNIGTPVYSKPLNRLEVAKILGRILIESRNNEHFPNSLRNELIAFLPEYKHEFDTIRPSIFPTDQLAVQSRTERLIKRYLPFHWPESMWENHGHLFSYEYGEEGGWLTVDPSYWFQIDQRQKDDLVFRRGWGVVFEASPLPWLSIMTRWQDQAEWGRAPYGTWNDRSKVYDDRMGMVNSTHEKQLVYEDLTGGILLSYKPIHFFLGRDRIRWGPGRYGNLMFSGESMSFSQGRLTLKLGDLLRFTSLTGSLSPWPELRDSIYVSNAGWTRRTRPNKFLAAHRAEISLFNRLVIGLNESVVYGEKELNLNYLNPMTVYFTEEHENGDEDNALMGFDFWWKVRRSFSVWGELLLDDFQFGKLGKSYYSNKTGLLLGAAHASQIRGALLETGMEYAKLRPYTYSHFYQVNSYKHWNAPLGLQMQPNSDRTTLWADLRVNSSMRFGAEFHYLRHGANLVDGDSLITNVGGDYDIGWIQYSDPNAPFLAGELREERQIDVWMDMELLERLYLHAMAGAARHSYSSTYEMIFSTGISWNYPLDRLWSLRGK